MATTTQTKANSAFPFMDADVTKIFADFKAPTFDMEAVLVAQRKNIEAFTAASQLAFEGMQTISKRQSEMAKQMMEQGSALTRGLVSQDAPEAKAAKQADLLKQSYEKAINNCKEIIKLCNQCNDDAANVLSKRVSESFGEVKSTIKSAQK